LATRSPAASKIAQEKSSRSLMLTDQAVLASVAPIWSATDMNRLLNTSSSTGSASVPAAGGRATASTRRRIRFACPSTLASQPGSITVVAVASVITAGPAIRVAVPQASRR